MRSIVRPLVGVSLLCVLSVLASCRGIPQPPPQNSEGLTIEVIKVKPGKRTIEVNAKIHSAHDVQVSFDVSDVRLIRAPGDEVSPNPPRGGVQRSQVPPKNSADMRWIFPLDTALPTGSYTIVIKVFRKLDIDQPNPIEFQINV